MPARLPARLPIVDVTTYNGEPIMERRLRYLAPLVDAFVIVEAAHTHAGHRKPAYYFDVNAKAFEPYASKIKFVRIDSFPPHVVGAWAREKYQRDAALGVLLAVRAAADADAAGGRGGLVAVVADSDEVPTADALATLATPGVMHRHPVVHLDMAMMYYSPHTMVQDMWRKAFAVCASVLTPATSLTELRAWDPHAALMPGAGFHLSFFMTPDEVRRKIESYAHREFDTDEVKSRIDANVLAGRDVLGRPGMRLVPTPEAVLLLLPPEFR